MISFFIKFDAGTLFYLPNNDKNEFIVGRKDCDFMISNDPSISRKHAIIRKKEGMITLEDCGSKYNTKLNGKKMKPMTEVQLNNNDEIYFGVIDSKYRLEQHRIVTTGTRLNSTQKIKLKADLASIGGQYIENWTPECTHLTVEEITLTVKILHAIVDEKPIVKPAFWTKYAENVAVNLPPPNIDKYNRPPIAEALLNNIEFKSNLSRKQLFKNKLFVFSGEKNKKQMEDIIRKAGGTSISWEKEPMPLHEVKNSLKEFVIIQTPDLTDNSDLNQIVKHFSKHGKRTIPLQEIAMAILLCSCEKDCNPNFNRVEEVFPTSQPNEPTQNNALVPGTQSQYFSIKKYKEEEDDKQMIIPDTIENDIVLVPSKNDLPSTSKCNTEKEKNSNGQTLKRINQDLSKENPPKKIKIDKETTSKQNLKVKQEKDNFISKDSAPQKRPVDNDENTARRNENRNIDIEVNPFAFLNKNKKYKVEMNSGDKNDNPFKSQKTQRSTAVEINDENPFKSFIGKKRKEDDSPDLSICKKKKEDSKERIFTSTKINKLDLSVNFSKISKINTSNSIWYSKNTTVEIKQDENLDNTFDSEMQKFIDQFKDTVIVEAIIKLPKREIYQNRLNNEMSPKGKLNFKSF